LPQTYEHKILSWDKHWELISLICKEASRQNANILISLHPKMNIAQYEYLEKTFSLKIAKHALREILVSADVFVAGQGSSTLVWAFLCDIPTVICDWFGLNYLSEYWNAAMDTVTDSTQFELVLKKNLDSEYQCLKVLELQNLDKKTLFDGLAMKRLIDSIESLV